MMVFKISNEIFIQMLITVNMFDIKSKTVINNYT